uniref:uncharacterized protein LOC122604651 n=1 Tax=Erigeron canadensis TaxID=72917 RepID=UPI001CB8FE98|nr:uncharacterized protein LOC122604651 [Erigeron canadensis]
MKGNKRLAVSDSTPDTYTTSINKKVMVPQFGSQRAAEQKSLGLGTSSLDMRRAESSRQHVRALNNQFASWVQSQLQDHPDELWEDGVRDYLTHASNILDKFSDVVNWIKVNSAKSDNLFEQGANAASKKLVTEHKDGTNVSFQEKTLNSAKNDNVFEHAAPKKLVTENKNNADGFFQDKTLNPPSSQSTHMFSTPVFTPSHTAQNNFVANDKENTKVSFQEKTLNSTKSDNLVGHGAPATQATPVTENKEKPNVFFQQKTANAPSFQTTPMFATSGFTPSWNTGSLFNNQAPISFGGQSSISVKPDAANDADGDDDIEQPSSPSLKKTKEAGIIVVHEVKCKLYVKSTDPADKDAWKDKGTGQLSIKCKEGVSKGTKDSKPTVLMRNDVGRLLLNALLYPGIKTNLQKNSIVAIFHTTDDNGSENGKVVARTFLIRTKSQEDRDKLAAAIQEYAPAA